MIKKFLLKSLIFVFISSGVVLGWVLVLDMGRQSVTTPQKLVEGEKSAPLISVQSSAPTQTPEQSSVAETQPAPLQVAPKSSSPEETGSSDQPPSPAQAPQPSEKTEGVEKPPQTAPAPPQSSAQQVPGQGSQGSEKPPQTVPAQPQLPAQQAPKGLPPMPVEVSKVISRPVRSNTPLTGTVLPITAVTVSTLISGQVEEVKIEEGDMVAQGDVLARLRDIEAKIDVQEAEAALEKAKRELQKWKSGSREQEIKAKQAEAAEKKAVMQKFKRDLERSESLFSQGIINQSQRDSAEADYKMALSRYESAVANLDLTVEGTRAEDIAAAQAEVAMREAILARKQQLLKDTQIIAPISGSIVKKHVEVGEWINVGGQIADIVNYNVVKISIDVPEREIQAVKKGVKAEITVDAYPNEVFTGTITQVIPAANVNNRTFPVLIEIANTDFKLKPGMFARVNLILSEDSNTVLVSKDALLMDKDGKRHVFVVRTNPQDKDQKEEHVFEVQDTVARRVDVQTGLTDGNYIEVKGDIKAGELVVVTGNEVLRDKAPVRVVSQL